MAIRNLWARVRRVLGPQDTTNLSGSLARNMAMRANQAVIRRIGPWLVIGFRNASADTALPFAMVVNLVALSQHPVRLSGDELLSRIVLRRRTNDNISLPRLQGGWLALDEVALRRPGIVCGRFDLEFGDGLQLRGRFSGKLQLETVSPPTRCVTRVWTSLG